MFQHYSAEKEVEILLKYFESARANIIARLSARDAAILAYLAGLGAIAGIVLIKGSVNYDVLLIVPLFSASISTIITQHNLVMDNLYVHVVSDIYARLNQLGYHTNSWEISNTYIKTRGRSSGHRCLVDCLLFLIPAFVSGVMHFIFNAHIVTFGLLRLWCYIYSAEFLLFVATLIMIIYNMIKAFQHQGRINELKDGFDKQAAILQNAGW